MQYLEDGPPEWVGLISVLGGALRFCSTKACTLPALWQYLSNLKVGCTYLCHHAKTCCLLS